VTTAGQRLDQTARGRKNGDTAMENRRGAGRRAAGRRRAARLDNYVQRIVERDTPDISGHQHLDELPRLLRLIAARNAGELNIANLANDAGMPVRTLSPYLALLETLFLIQRVPAWSTNLSKRVVSRPKAMLFDTGLAARLVNASAAGASNLSNPELGGHLLEGFVAGELRRQRVWAEENARLSPPRSRRRRGRPGPRN